MVIKPIMGLSSVVLLESFTVFPEYFVAISAIYILIIIMLITYNQYNLFIQRALSESMAIILIMASYLIINDDLMKIDFSSFNNSLMNDTLGVFAKLIVCLSAAFFFLIIADSLKDQKLTSFEYLLILLFAVLGLMLLCSSNDLLTSYLAIELTALSSYVLASFKKNSSYSIDAGIKFFVTGAISSAFFLLGTSLIYAFSGSIYFVDLWDLLLVEKDFPVIQHLENKYGTSIFSLNESYILTNSSLDSSKYLDLWNWYRFCHFSFESQFLEFGLALVLFSIFIKLALAPFHIWSLDVYEGSPTSSTFFFATIAKFSTFIFLLRFCYKALIPLNNSWQFYCFLIGVVSIFVGSFGGIKQRRLKTLLAYSSTSHMGYTLIAFATGTKIGVEAVLFYLIIYIISGLVTWFIVLTLRLKNRHLSFKYNKELADFALLKKANFPLAFAFAIAMFSIAGIPPLIGFFAKMSVFLSVVSSEFYLVALASILCSVVSTFYYIRIIKIIYFENILVGKLYYPIKSDKTILLGLLTFCLIFLFINPTLLYLIIYDVVLNSFGFGC